MKIFTSTVLLIYLQVLQIQPSTTCMGSLLVLVVPFLLVHFISAVMVIVFDGSSLQHRLMVPPLLRGFVQEGTQRR